MPYRSPIPLPSDEVRAAAIHCSDGRYTHHCADFVREGLGIPHADLIVLPGGPACLTEHPQSCVDAAAALDELRFLTQAHGLHRVVLIAHQGCGLYAAATQLPDALLEGPQRVDLAQAAGRIRQIDGIETVEGWFLRIVDGKASFEPVPLV